jgi:hypothetical protein
MPVLALPFVPGITKTLFGFVYMIIGSESVCGAGKAKLHLAAGSLFFDLEFKVTEMALECLKTSQMINPCNKRQFNIVII